MNHVELEIVDSFERLFPTPGATGDWDDVLDRSHSRPSRLGVKRGRRRLVVAVAATLAVVVGSASAFGTARDLFLDTRVNSKIAFFSFRDGGFETYVMKTDGSGQRRLTSTTGAGVPTWSPDGRRIAYEQRGGQDINDLDIYIANADGSDRRRLTIDPAADGPPDWSPDGRKIAFQRWEVGTEADAMAYTSDVFVVNADGSGERNLTRDGESGLPDWSPDGRKISFTSARSIWVMNADGSGRRRLIRNDGGLPRWSPDGRKISFVRAGGVGRGGPAAMYAYVMNPDGSQVRRLTRLAQVNYSLPVWSPDGRRILFVSEGDGNFEVYVMNADGSGKRNLTRHPGHDSDPVWSADGQRIAFSTKRDGNFEIYVMKDDGSEQRNLTRHPGSDRAPNWSPGRR